MPLFWVSPLFIVIVTITNANKAVNQKRLKKNETQKYKQKKLFSVKKELQCFVYIFCFLNTNVALKVFFIKL
jgi:hypothetical protein